MPDHYCSHCGEQRLTEELRSVKHIIKDFVTDLTSVDSKLLRTVKTLFLSPGQLDYDYHIGKRIVYLKPITIFLIINVAYVMFSPVTDFYVSFHDQLNLQGYSPYIKPMIEAHISASEKSVSEFAVLYDQLVVVLARSLIILQVPIFGFFVWLLCYKNSHYSGDYLIFGLNFHSWLLVWTVFLQLPESVIHFVFNLFSSSDVLEGIYFLLLPMGLMVYLWLATKKLFRLSFVELIWRVPLLFVALAVSHYLFRFLQLLITVALVKT